jgi:uncharacterized membrane protein
MYGSEFCNFSFWWIFPVLMVILCFVMMRRRRGSMMCGFGSCCTDSDRLRASGSATEILYKRYASGEINKEEYDEKKQVLNQRD